MTVTITLSGEPVGKGRPRFVRATGHAFTPANTRKYESALRYAAQEAMAGAAPFEGPVSVEITAAFPIPVSWPKWRKAAALRGLEWATCRPDGDNVLKLAGDSLNEIVWRDDKQIVKFELSKIYSEHPSLTVIVEPLEVATRADPVPARAGAALGEFALLP